MSSSPPLNMTVKPSRKPSATGASNSNAFTPTLPSWKMNFTSDFANGIVSLKNSCRRFWPFVEPRNFASPSAASPMNFRSELPLGAPAFTNATNAFATFLMTPHRAVADSTMIPKKPDCASIP